MLQVAMLSRWHVHADDYARQAMEHPELNVSLVWDEEPQRGKQWAAQLGVPFEEKLDDVLENPAIDAVIICTPTNMHKEVISRALLSGKHVFTEKVLAFTAADCEELYSIAEKKQAKLMVSLPRLTQPGFLYAEEVLKQGLLGELTFIRARMAHDGAVPRNGHSGWLPEHFFDPEACGGGAFIDLGAHPIYMTNRLAGKARSVTARFSSYYGHPVDDNSVVVVEYESGSMGVIETSFVSGGSPLLLELHGTDGILLFEDGEVRIRSRRIQKEGWVTPESLPPKQPSPLEQWVFWIQEGRPPSITKEDVIQLSQINEWAALSHQKGCAISL